MAVKLKRTWLFIRPRLTEHYGLALSQASVPFAIPFLNEDLPLYVDPFLLWKSPSQQDFSLHAAMLQAFNRIGHDGVGLRREEAIDLLIQNVRVRRSRAGIVLHTIGKADRASNS